MRRWIGATRDRDHRATNISLVLALLLSLLVSLPTAPARAISPDLVISQVYGGGGNSGADYTHDFIELFNRGTAPASLAGMSVQYASATGTGNFGATSGQLTELPSASLAPGQYLLIQEAQGGGGTTPLPAPDVTDATPINMSGTAGKVALVDTTATLGCNGGSTPCSPAQLASIVDLVGYGTANFFEGAGAAPGLSNTTSDSRVGGGCQDTDDNSADFSAGAPNPRNTASPFNVCGSTGTPRLVINEVDYDQPGTDTAEFLELKNAGDGPADLVAYSVELVNGTGGGAAVYATVSLPDTTLPAGAYFVVCADAATVANCDLDVSPDSNLIQNGAPDAVGLRSGADLVDAVSYEGDTGAPYTEGSGAGLDDPGADGSISRCADGADTDQNNVDFVFVASTPGAANSCAPPPAMCTDAVTHFVHDVQGSGVASPIVGDPVAVEAVVVGDFQNNGMPDDGDLSGFYIQEEDTDADADAATSEGVFVFAPAAPDVSVGDVVRVEGTASEFSGLTEIGSVDVVLICATGATLPTPATVALPVTSLAEHEAVEGMSVVIPQDLVISEYFNYDRFGEIVLTSQRQLTPTAVVEPGPAATALAASYLLDRLTLDDGRSTQNPNPAIHPNGANFDLTNLFRGGDTVANVTGVMDYAFGLYRIQPTQGADYTPANPRPATPDDVGGTLEVASFNVLNYFTTLDDAGPICGPAADQDCRGADDADELERQRSKIVAALSEMDADVVGLIEIENNPGDGPTADLVSGLNDALGAGTYDYIATGAIGTDAIRVAMIYKPASVTPLGAYAVLDTSVDPRFLDGFNRPVLAQTFQDDSTGGVFTLAVNHLKSKGSDCNSIGDPDTGDGSGNCNLTRTAAAEALVDWLATDPTGSGDADFLIMGDLNSYDKEDPIDAILAGGYTDLIRAYQGEEAYSYVFDAQIGYLDHALAGADLVAEITGTTVWHINADEPDLIDYDTSFKQDEQDDLFAPDPYRSSDHDPVIVGLGTCDEIAPTIEVSVTPDVLWPPNHKYVTVRATVDAADNFDTSPTVTLLSVTSNEPDNGPDDGNTINDVVIVNDYRFKLRAERSGIGTGRVYTITYMVTDDCGNETIGTAHVTVPLAQ